MTDLPRHYRDKLTALAQHEMGHYVASRHFGFATGDVSIQADLHGQGHRGGSTIELNFPIESIGELDRYLTRRIIVLYAGAMSEPLFIGSPTKRMSDADQKKAVELSRDPKAGASIDFAKSRELRFLLRNIRHPRTDKSDNAAILSELRAIEDEVWLGTVAVVDQHYQTICGLASNLVSRHSAIGETISISAEELEGLQAVADIVPV